MFFYLSKIIGFFLIPTNFLCCVGFLGLLLTRTRHAQVGLKLLSGTTLALLIMAFSPLGNWIILPLENRFSTPADQERFKAPYGIIVLGGAIDTIITRERGTVAVNESGERLFEAVKLARQFPKARIVFSGGSGHILYANMSESIGAQRFFSQMKIAPHRLSFENKSKNTWQNARFTTALLKPKADQRWFLVTSAFHMARSLGCFRKAGMDVIPWPVDFRTRGNSDLYRFFDRASEGWKRVDIAVREWIGLVVYRLTGRTSSFFPSATPASG